MLPMLLGHFILFGLLIGGTGVLWAELFATLRLSEGAFGSAQLMAGLVSVVLLNIGGAISKRLGFKWLTLIGLVLLCTTMLAMALVGGLWTYILTLLIWGLGQACLDLAMNGAVLEWERSTGRSVINVMHAGFSGGAMLGAFGAGALLGVHWNYEQVFWLLALVIAVVLALTLVVTYPPVIVPDAEPSSSVALRMLFDQRALLVLAMIGLFSILAESAVNIWSVIYLRTLGAKPVLSGVAFGLFNAAMLAGRLGNAPLVARYGARVSLLLSGVAMLLAALLLIPGGIVPTIVAFVVLGLAIAGVMPTVMSASMRQSSGASGAVVSVMMVAAYMGFIICPPVTGWLAELLSLRAVLVLVAFGGLPLFWMAWRLR